MALVSLSSTILSGIESLLAVKLLMGVAVTSNTDGQLAMTDQYGSVLKPSSLVLCTITLASIIVMALCLSSMQCGSLITTLTKAIV